MTQNKSTTEHSWFNLNAHLCRKNGSFVRCNIRELFILPYVCFHVQFLQSNILKHKRVTPYQLIVLNKQWNRVAFMSDIEGCDPMHEHYVKEPQKLPSLELNDRISISDIEQSIFSLVRTDIDVIAKVLDIGDI